MEGFGEIMTLKQTAKDSKTGRFTVYKNSKIYTYVTTKSLGTIKSVFDNPGTAR